MSIGKIEAVEVAGPGRIGILWDDGSRGLVDLSALISARSVLAPLRDSLEFSQVQVSADGWSLEWPSGIDFGAPQLRQWSEGQHAQTSLDSIDA